MPRQLGLSVPQDSISEFSAKYDEHGTPIGNLIPNKRELVAFAATLPDTEVVLLESADDLAESA